VTVEQGTAAMFTDPTGAAFATWQRHGRFAGAQVSYEPGAVCWFELAAHDPSAADDFYNEVFGWRVLEAESPPGDPMFEFRHHGDTVGGLVPIDHRFPQRDIASHWTVCFMVDDHDETAERVAKLGGTVLREPMQTPTGWYTRVRDPLGAHFGIIELSDQFRID
jgi:predicted enzyme related to lactoylglutathione lyase